MTRKSIVIRSLSGNIPALLKYILTAGLIIFASDASNPGMLGPGLLQLAVIILISDVLVEISPVFQIVSGAAMLLLNTEYAILYFSNSFLTLTMLQNLDSLKDLSGHALLYSAGVSLVVFISLMPVRPFFFRRKLSLSLIKIIAAAALQASSIMLFQEESPVGSLIKLRKDYGTYAEMMKIIESHEYEIAESARNSVFYKTGITDRIAKPVVLTRHPNIILIFAEGLSRNIITDERNIMPHLSELSNQSISFTSCYNHTFATYHAIQGQLFSGFQFNNYDTNNLISLQSILSSEGYTTRFLNTEPENKEFTQYLNNLGFDEVRSSTELTEIKELRYVSDKDALAYLFEQAKEMNESGKPFFLSTYTFGTHATLDSPHVKFGEGNEVLLNRFHNLDVHLSDFLERFRNSELYDNTILVFTADHATYADQDFTNAFPDFSRFISTADEIPLLIYHKDVEEKSIDAGGRTSLDLVPTVLDYLDISKENLFMGSTLFSSDDAEEIEYVSWNSEYALNTYQNELSWIKDEKLDELTGLLKEYFILAAQKNILNEETISSE